MDIYSNDSAGIQQGNMRTRSVMDANQAVSNHNDKVANDISNLRGQQQTSQILDATKNATSQFWAAGKVPEQVKAFNQWNKAPTATNPVSQAQGAAADIKSPSAAFEAPKTTTGVPELKDTGDGVFESETSLSTATTTADDVAEDVGSKLGKGVGTLGSVATAGIDIYQDYNSLKAGHGIAGDNWASKTSNLLQIGGAIADVGGTVFPPLAMVGGAVDLIAGGFGELGDVLSAKKTSAADDATQSKETQSYSTAGVQQVDTARVS
tara:strand:+ start:813 stop:1607 length:795 start_codon:yes stop_codon:yes gene_type:complete